MLNRFSRRQLLALLGAGAATATAGCSGVNREDDAAAQDIAFPQVRFSTESDWELFDEQRTVHDTQYTVTPYEATRMYEHIGLRQDISDLTLDQFDQTLALFFASHIRLEGAASVIAITSSIADTLQEEFVEQLSSQGIESIQQMETTGAQPDLSTSFEIREFSGTYQTPEIQQEIPLEDRSETITIESSSMPIRAFFVVWKEDSSTAFAAGGAYPAENFRTQDSVTVTGAENEGIDAGVFVNLPMQPTQIRSQMVDLVGTVQLP